MPLLTKEQIIASEDLKHEDVEVPEWGGSVRVVAMSGTARDAFEDTLVKRVGEKIEQDLGNYRAKVCAACMIDEDGNRLFSAKEVQALGQKSSAAIERVFDAADRLNGLTRGNVEASAKN